MNSSEDKIQFVPLIIGIAVLCAIIYIIKILLPPESLIFFYGFLGLAVVGIIIIVIICFKDAKFRDKTLAVVKKLLSGISKLGLELLEDKDKKVKKKRIPISNEIKNEVFDIAGGKCQECGKKGNLKIHHIDGNPSNNRITNLILLCGNHHDEADKGVIPKWRLKNLRDKQATPDHTSYSK